MPIDWWRVGAGLLWIAGLSIVLATCSYHYWRVSAAYPRRAGRLLADRTLRVSLSSGMVLVCVGWAALRPRSWQQWLWIALAIGFLGDALAQGVRRRGTRGEPFE